MSKKGTKIAERLASNDDSLQDALSCIDERPDHKKGAFYSVRFEDSRGGIYPACGASAYWPGGDDVVPALFAKAGQMRAPPWSKKYRAEITGAELAKVKSQMQTMAIEARLRAAKKWWQVLPISQRKSWLETQALLPSFNELSPRQRGYKVALAWLKAPQNKLYEGDARRRWELMKGSGYRSLAMPSSKENLVDQDLHEDIRMILSWWNSRGEEEKVRLQQLFNSPDSAVDNTIDIKEVGRWLTLVDFSGRSASEQQALLSELPEPWLLRLVTQGGEAQLDFLYWLAFEKLDVAKRDEAIAATLGQWAFFSNAWLSFDALARGKGILIFLLMLVSSISIAWILLALNNESKQKHAR